MAGEFTKWFHINFEGEGRDEIDFRDNKCEMWKSAVKLSEVLIQEASRMQGRSEDILS